MYLIPRVIKHARACKAAGTLVVPCWPSAVFWLIICPNGEKFADFILDTIELPQMEGTIVPGKRGNSITMGKPSFNSTSSHWTYFPQLYVGGTLGAVSAVWGRRQSFVGTKCISAKIHTAKIMGLGPPQRV